MAITMILYGLPYISTVIEWAEKSVKIIAIILTVTFVFISRYGAINKLYRRKRSALVSTLCLVFVHQLKMQSNSKVSIQWNFLILISVTFITIKINALDEYRIVDTKYGKIRGFRNRTLLDQVDFYSFKGVYYAKNPVGNLRFKVRIFRIRNFCSFHF